MKIGMKAKLSLIQCNVSKHQFRKTGAFLTGMGEFECSLDINAKKTPQPVRKTYILMAFLTSKYMVKNSAANSAFCTVFY
jgi:hypothetical protein